MDPKRISCLVLLALFIAGMWLATRPDDPEIAVVRSFSAGWFTIENFRLTLGVAVSLTSAVVFVLIAWLWKVQVEEIHTERVLPDGTTEKQTTRRRTFVVTDRGASKSVEDALKHRH